MRLILLAAAILVGLYFLLGMVTDLPLFQPGVVRMNVKGF